MNTVDVKVMPIMLSSIYGQKNIPNRTRREVEQSQAFNDLYNSIKNTPGGLIHPITVREDINGRYELFAGFRRVMAYLELKCSGEKRFETILASVWPPETTDEEMLLMTIAENKERANLSSIKSLEAKIALVPFFLNCGIHGRSKTNKKMGYDILKLYNSFIRGGGNNDEKLKEIIELTGCDNAYEQLDKFFKGINETERNFYDKASVLVNASPEIVDLLYKKRIAMRHAKALRTMKSDTDRETLVEELKNKKIPYKELEARIRESNLKNNPLRRRDALVKYAKNISIILEDKKKDLTEDEHKKIKAYLQEIEETLLGER